MLMSFRRSLTTWSSAYTTRRHTLAFLQSSFIKLKCASCASLSHALPDRVVAAIAQRLRSLYLRIDADFDTIYHENIFLEKPMS